MKTIKDIILGRKDPGNLHAWAKTNEDHSIDLGIWYNGKWNFIGGSAGGGGGVSEDQFVHFTVNQDETVTTDITQSELDSLIEKYKYMVYGIVTIEDITMILPLVQVVSSTTEPIYIFSSPGYSSGFDVIVKYKNGESNVELHSLAQIINELIQG